MKTIVVSVLLLSAPLASAQQPTLEDPLLDRLVGRWVLTGTITGRQTTHDVDAEWVLNHQFVRVHEISRDKAGNSSSPEYEAIVLIGWDAKRSDYVVYWTDVFGGGFSLTGRAPRAPSQLPFVFTGPDGRFFTTFAYDAKADTWAWAMDNEQNGKKREFARLSLSRVR